MGRSVRQWIAVVALLVMAAGGAVRGQSNRIDTVAPSAPELAAYGPYAIGVRTLSVTDRNRPDVLQTRPGGPMARYDRTLTLEVWYPAASATSTTPRGEYHTILRDPSVHITLSGRAIRDASAAIAAAPFPLVVISHGYPGNRYLLSHLAENLASKGYAVVSIDHPDSTYDDQKAFASTLYNRPFDQLFVVAEVARLAERGSGSVLAGLVDASRTAVIGYSMGGYGAVNVIGGGYRTGAADLPASPPNRLLLDRGADNPAYRAAIDPRIKAAIAIGPWGMQAGYWDAAGLAGIRTPVLFVAGSADEVSGYEKGTRAIFDAAVNADRYLLTFLNANHNAAAPIPAPAESYTYSEMLKGYAFTHYADPVWDTVRMNNILAHFATAFLDVRLQAEATRSAYLDVVPRGADGIYAVDRNGLPDVKHTYWKGFSRGTAVGLVLEHRTPAAPAP